MKCYRVYNGWNGATAVYCIVIANDEKEAMELATPKFKKEAKEQLGYVNNYEDRYPKSYYTNLEAELIFDDVIRPISSEPDSG